jgi:alpha-tubulin suppressor-like RCC1 family protein
MHRFLRRARTALVFTSIALAPVGVVPTGAYAASGVSPNIIITRTVVDVATWGDNSFGQLGDGTSTSRSAWAPIPSISGVLKIAAGHNHNLAIMSDNTVDTWGANGSGQLGYGYWVNSTVPQPVPGLTNVVAIAGGWQHSLAVRSDGTVWAWGDNQYGELGNGTLVSPGYTPTQVVGLTGVTKVAAGNGWSLALKSDGTVWAWGADDNGMLGTAVTDNSDVPVQIAGLSNVTDIAAGAQHGLAIESGGTVWAWGEDWLGQLGNGTACICGYLLPVQVLGIPSAAAIAAGDLTSVMLGTDGSVWTWGDNSDGALGDGSTVAARVTPAAIIAAGSGIVRIASGGNHSVALTRAGAVEGWGSYAHGELGIPGTQQKHATIVIVSGLTAASAVAAGSEDTLAVYTTQPITRQ